MTQTLPTEICKSIVFRGVSRSFLRDGLTCRGFLDTLIVNDEYGDAIRFLAHALPKRHAVWWGCLCLWRCHRPDPDPAIAAVIESAKAWVLDPTEANRRAAEQPARQAGLTNPAGCLGMAVFWSGGSMGKPNLPVVPPPPLLTAQAISGAVLLAAARSGLQKERRQVRREFIAMGMQIATQCHLWRHDAETSPVDSHETSLVGPA